MAGVYTVTQINSYIKNMFRQDFVLNRIQIKGEISNCKYHTSGHIYFTLKDSGGTIAVVMFASYASKLDIKLENGMSVVVDGRIDIYERDGRYQLYAVNITESGMGDLYKKFEQLKQQYDDMGYFDSSYKRPIPRFARKIGIVTASTGAAIHDIMNISHRRNPYVSLYLYPALVQGEYAKYSIAKGIAVLDKFGVDCIIVGRGGGSLEDLWAFNEEITARAIFNSNIPIISAVGHETDFTIADFVADLRAPTPSAAAEIAVPSMIELRNRINTDKNRISQNIVKRIESCKLLLKRFKMRTPKDRIDDYYLKIDSLVKSMDNCIKMKTMSLRRQLAEQAAKLDALSPLQTLSRGYSIPTKEDGTVIRSANDMEKGMEFTLRMKDGQTNCVVKGE